MDTNINWLNETKIKRTIESLEKNNILGYYAKDKQDLINKIKEIINTKDTVACGGSITLFETGVIDFIRENDYNFLDRYDKNLTPQDLKQMYRESFSAQCYLTSTNAITEEGELYNVDGNGNRVAAMLYGPDKVIVICGVNKIVKDLDEAIKRNKYISAPANAKRLSTKTPCKSVGYCMDCSSPDRICCEYTVIKRQRIKNRMHVIILNEILGY